MNNLIATELSNQGFTTRITQTGVLVSLNSLISRWQVEIALEQAFEGMEFRVVRISKNSVHVSES